MRIELGQRVQDSITKFSGVAFGTADYLTGCRKVCVQPETCNEKDGSPSQAEWFDESRLQVVDRPAIVLPSSPAESGPGCDMPDAPRS